MRLSVRNRSGTGTTEYIIISFLVAISVIGVIALFGDNLRALFATADDGLAGVDSTPLTEPAKCIQWSLQGGDLVATGQCQGSGSDPAAGQGGSSDERFTAKEEALDLARNDPDNRPHGDWELPKQQRIRGTEDWSYHRVGRSSNASSNRQNVMETIRDAISRGDKTLPVKVIEDFHNQLDRQYWADSGGGVQWNSKQEARKVMELLSKPEMPSGHRSPRGSVDHTTGEEADRYLRSSPSIGRYVRGKIDAGDGGSGNVHFHDSGSYLNAHTANMIALGYPRDWAYKTFTQSGGFTHNGQVHIHEIRGGPSTVVHETIHNLSERDFQNTFGTQLNEGVTQYFTLRVAEEQQLGLGEEDYVYEGWVDVTERLVSRVGERAVADAYFHGDVGRPGKGRSHSLSKRGAGRRRGTGLQGKLDRAIGSSAAKRFRQAVKDGSSSRALDALR